ncbi:hypothetical protein J40TS1_33910 [Paenibacillus montaniterrae]|uniref:Uncharacterized protein n=1 Tax=Paenibacillus montaniterrae TaxID=429341 RepID=A0A919YT90_9BACL|nr:hypothetical protein [Paenibacillus montaniterrae]GIP17749.1 hypothetical protein J40TS1_33910 [Paenibacillus montaniterrae]
MTLVNKDEVNINTQLMDVLIRIQGVISKIPVDELDNLDDLIIRLHDIIETLDIVMLPYPVITQFVYENKSHDLLYMVHSIQDKYKAYCEDEVSDNFNKFLKMVAHFELAQQQKNYLYKQQAEEILKIHERSMELDAQFKKQQEEFELQLKHLEKLEKKLSKLNSNVKGATTQFISILGIFAAILLGSFGAMQGFTSLFNNAQNMSIGKLLIISSVGASSVILILFFLVNSIAKLTDKNLSSSKDDNSSLIARYPVMTLSYGIIVLISLIGSALELSNYPLRLSIYGLWWILPLLWTCYFIYSIHKKSFLWFLNRKERSDALEKQSTNVDI